MLNVFGLFGGVRIAMNHDDLFERMFAAGDTQNNVEDNGGFSSVGLRCQQRAKRVREIESIAIIVPLFVKRLLVILKRDKFLR